jgi:hypothetical protein
VSLFLRVLLGAEIAIRSCGGLLLGGLLVYRNIDHVLLFSLCNSCLWFVLRVFVEEGQKGGDWLCEVATIFRSG